VSFTVSTTTKVTTGVSSKSKISESFFFEKGSEEFDFSFSRELDVSKSNTQTTTTEKDWEQDLTVTVGPRSHVYSQCALSQGKIDSPYDLKVKLHTPIVWACVSPEDSERYIFPSDPVYWQSFNIEQDMKDSFGFSSKDLEKIFSAKTGGTFQAIMGQKVVCKTHSVPLKTGESCKQRGSKSNFTSVFV
jgi:hypothetical protein